MDYSERRRVNRLLRKPTNSNLAKSLSLRQKLSRGIHKSSKTPTPTEKNQKHEFTTDVCNLCAEMCGVSDISASASVLLQKHLNQIARLLIHEVLRVMEQSRRGVPQASDVDLASILIGLEPPFGTTPANFLPIRTSGRTASAGPGGKVFFIRPDKEMDVKALMLREPAGVVYDVSLVAHWLSVNGKQPTSPQNPPPDFLAKMALLNNSFGLKSFTAKKALPDSTKNSTSDRNNLDPKRLGFSRDKEDKSSLESVAHPRKVLAMSIERREHEISQEVMIYFRELTEACVGASETRRHEALDNATLDPGLQPILPHLVTFITEGVRINVTNHNLAILIYLMRLVKALVDNPHISLEPYLHMLVPTVITCVLNRQLCAKPITDNHWALRDFAAKQLVTLCNRHNTSTNELYNRVTRELSRAMYNWIDGTTSTSGSVCSSATSLPGPKLSDPKTSELEKSTDSTTTLPPPLPSTASGPSSTPVTVGLPSSSDSRKLECADNASHSLSRGPSLGSAINSMNTLYGILVILSEFGAQCLRCMVFPILPALCHRLTILTKPNSFAGDTDSIFDGDNPMAGAGASVVGGGGGSQHSLVSLGIGSKLSPVDQRSFDALKTMMTNRLASSLHDWRLRQGLGVTMEDYRASYECMASCLFVNHRNSTTVGPSSTTPATTPNPAQQTSVNQQQQQQQQHHHHHQQ